MINHRGIVIERHERDEIYAIEHIDRFKELHS